MCAFHSPEYIKHIKNVEPNLLGSNPIDYSTAAQINLNPGATSLEAALNDFKIGENDCPCFEGMFEFS
jgi:hypothetical protein